MPCLRSGKTRAFSAQDDWLGFIPRQDFAAICDLNRVIGIERLLAGIPGQLGSSREDLIQLTQGYFASVRAACALTLILEESRWVRCARNAAALSVQMVRRVPARVTQTLVVLVLATLDLRCRIRARDRRR